MGDAIQIIRNNLVKLQASITAQNNTLQNLRAQSATSVQAYNQTVATISSRLAVGTTPDIAQALPAAAGEANAFRVIFFILTFFSIGVLSDFRKLWQQGFGKLAAVYFVSLFGFVIWVGLLISWLFFSGVKPPLAS